MRALPTVVGVVVLIYFFLRLVPGDAADAIAADAGAATSAGMEALRARLGLDQSLITQFGQYVWGLLHLDLGQSVRYNAPVIDLIWQRLPDTVLLMVTAMTIAVALGIVMGMTMARFAGRLPDRLLSVLALVFYSVPGFWIGLMLIVVFSVQLGWLPSGGSGPIGRAGQGWAGVLVKPRYLLLPSVSLGLFYLSIYARLTRASMLEQAGQDYVRTALAKGLSPRKVMFRHVLRNALLPVTTMVGMHVGAMLGGAVVVETVYNWPGLGKLSFEAILSRDFNVLMAILLLSSFLVIAANVMVDLVHGWLDPRIQET